MPCPPAYCPLYPNLLHLSEEQFQSEMQIFAIFSQRGAGCKSIATAAESLYDREQGASSGGRDAASGPVRWTKSDPKSERAAASTSDRVV